MTQLSVVPAQQFVVPTSKPELGGDPGLGLWEIAQSIQRKHAEVRDLLDANLAYLEQVEKSTYTNSNGLAVESFVVSTDDAKFLVARSNTHEGRMYTKFLIQAEKQNQVRGEFLRLMSEDPIIRERMLAHSERQAEQLKTLQSNFSVIAGKESGKAKLAAENLQLKTKLGEAETWKKTIAAQRMFPDTLGRMTPSACGKLLTRISKDLDIRIQPVPHQDWGTVNAYHIKAVTAAHEFVLNARDEA